ncbi:hypothetical protein [Nocardiopsis halotolerans]|uniref:hypothetical protein n=1 Tax=Nocardiopsis halotolerans TaxID=124252 RepID=UPI00034DB041|nr:hypothetical protein [Nocardiopsis halotolerans]
MLFGFYLSWRARRIHRLHHRVDAARAALDAALDRRHAAVSALVEAGGTGAGRGLSEAVTAARDAGEEQCEMAESALSRALREALESSGSDGCSKLSGPRLNEVESAAKGVHMARTFYNDAVADTRRARRSRLVRLFRLTGTAALPDFFEIDDQPPSVLFLPVEPDTL